MPSSGFGPLVSVLPRILYVRSVTMDTTAGFFLRGLNGEGTEKEQMPFVSQDGTEGQTHRAGERRPSDVVPRELISLPRPKCHFSPHVTLTPITAQSTEHIQWVVLGLCPMAPLPGAFICLTPCSKSSLGSRSTHNKNIIQGRKLKIAPTTPTAT